MIDATELVEKLSPELAALNIDAAFFQQINTFSIYDCYPELGGKTYRVRVEIDLQEEKVSDVAVYERPHSDVHDIEITPSPELQSVVDRFLAVLTSGVDALAENKPLEKRI